MRIRFFWLFFLCLSCNKSEEELSQLPEQTEIGANTLGFKLNGTIWTINGRHCFNQYGNCRENPLTRSFPFKNGQVFLSADKVLYKGLNVKSSESLEFSIKENFNRTGIYKLRGVDSLYEATFTNATTWNYYKLAPDRETFEVNIKKLDTVAKVVSGTFSGRLFRSDNSSDSISISEGRFDIKIQ